MHNLDCGTVRSLSGHPPLVSRLITTLGAPISSCPDLLAPPTVMARPYITPRKAPLPRMWVLSFRWGTFQQSQNSRARLTHCNSYGDGSAVTGEEYTDTVTISGLTATKQTLGSAATYSTGFGDQYPAEYAHILYEGLPPEYLSF